jgi:hypothetical protein
MDLEGLLILVLLVSGQLLLVYLVVRLLPFWKDKKEVRQVLKAKQTEYKAYSATLTSPHALFKLNLLLPRVNRALEKLDEGTYHLCDACEDEIPVERLRLVPAAVYCVACQEAYDVRYASG